MSANLIRGVLITGPPIVNRLIPNMTRLKVSTKLVNPVRAISLSCRLFDDRKDDGSDHSPNESQELSPTAINESKVGPAKELSVEERAKQKLELLLTSMSKRSPDDLDTFDSAKSLSNKMARPVRRKKADIKPKELSIDDVSPGLNERLMKAARQVSSSMGERQFEKSALFQVLKAHDEETQALKTGHPVTLDLSKIVDGMKIVKKDELSIKSSRHQQMSRQRRADQEELDDGTVRQRPQAIDRQLRTRRRPPTETSDSSINIYKGESLGIFEPSGIDDQESSTTGTAEGSPLPALDTWDQLRREELKMMATHPPTNPFEEMIRWTEQGKLWHYPIDNEQGLDSEQQVPFYEHVFLDQWLEGFPERGPVRDFMEVMVLGLSKNPYLTVGRKRAYLDWFRAYFNDKKDLLRQTGSL